MIHQLVFLRRPHLKAKVFVTQKYKQYYNSQAILTTQYFKSRPYFTPHTKTHAVLQKFYPHRQASALPVHREKPIVCLQNRVVPKKCVYYVQCMCNIYIKSNPNVKTCAVHSVQYRCGTWFLVTSSQQCHHHYQYQH